MISRSYILVLLLAGFATAPAVYSQCPMSRKCAETNFWQRRLHSAGQLIADGHEWQKNASDVKKRALELAEKSGSQAELVSEYQALLQQYQQVLAAYRQHRAAYSEHAKSFHDAQSTLHPKDSKPAQLPDADRQVMEELQIEITRNMQMGTGPKEGIDENTYKTINVVAEDKCQELQALETSILSNEDQLETMLKQLASGKLSPTAYAALWLQAHGLAVQNMSQNNQANHVGLAKIAQNSQNTKDAISQANRDGVYADQVTAYKHFNRCSDLEHQIYQRLNRHEMGALTTFVGVLGKKPPNLELSGAPPSAGAQAATADELLQESRALDKEYSNVQTVFKKLQAVRQALPPKLQAEAK